MKCKYLLLSLVLFISACSKVNIHNYANTSPSLDLREFFDGDLKAYGILQNRSGKVTRKFSADIKAYWQGSQGFLDETFYFDDGEVSKRFWTLKDKGNGQITGSADDVIGEAEGSIEGFAFHWVYTLEIPYKEDTIEVKLDDWLYLVTEDRLLNRSSLRKFGFEVGQLTLVIEKLDSSGS
ncbi:DUF3833 domain-containing protein [Agarilytica rhodophyticola]|uniref:DUF3833 domain-containing protein n=1 Tax=Agarilytica rhodophyticola TaxID=1737490 RepID=UPI000B3415E0|nr:DUF3833 domain-containing protein [Agarilytica rhodophyticola]